MIYCLRSECKPTRWQDIPCDRCPHCGRMHTLRLHGYYERGEVWWQDGAPRSRRVSVCVVRCVRCGRIDALLPTDLVGRSKINVGVWMRVAIELRKASHAAPEVARRFRLSVSTCRKARCGADRVAEALGRALDDLAEALARGDGGSRAIAARFARKCGTTPFSCLELALVSRGVVAECGVPPDT